VIRRKRELADFAKKLYEEKGEKLQSGDIYDKLVTSLFKNNLHQADENRIIFARLGKSERREALAHAIIQAKKNFEKKWNKGYDKPFIIDVKQSSEEIGLQIVDYYLWALQRLYEKNDDSFFNILAPNYSLIIDLDDKRKRWSGEWYSRNNPLTLQKIKPLVS
jgi:succinyl-CoA synthetase beta subunit